MLTPRPAARLAPARQSRAGVPTPLYTAAEKELVRQLYSHAPKATILASLPTRTWTSICSQASRMRVTRGHVCHPRKWSEAQLQLLRERYPAEGAASLAPLVGRTVDQVRRKARVLGVARVLPPRAPRVRKPRQKVERPAKVPKVKLPKPKPAPKPKAVKPLKPPKPVVEVPAPKRIAATPLANARQAERRRNRDKVEQESIVKQVQRLPANSPGRQVYMLAARHGGPAAAEAFRAWQAQQKQPKQAA